MQPKSVADSAIIDHRMAIAAEDLNENGHVMGAKILQKADHIAATVAKNHAGRSCIALGIDSVRFQSSAQKGDLLLCKCSVNRTWDAKLELGVKVVAEDLRSLEHKEVLTAYFLFAAVDEELKPVQIAPVLPETREEWRRFEEAEMRKRRHEFILV